MDLVQSEKITSEHKHFKTGHLARLLVDMSEADLEDSNLEKMLERLFNCGQVKQHKPTKKFTRKEYLSYEQPILDKLLH